MAKSAVQYEGRLRGLIRQIDRRREITVRLQRPGIPNYMNLAPATEVSAEPRFPFGANWRRFIATLTDEQIGEAVLSLQRAVRLESLAGMTFLDVGSGSGLFSLAARKLGAKVCSMDNDPQSVNCALELKARYRPGDNGWTIETGSVLDLEYLRALGRFDIVYCWGVLHHTGDLDRALQNVVISVAANGKLFLSIYNDQGWRSRYWTFTKRMYNHGAVYRGAIILAFVPLMLGPRYAVRAFVRRPSQGRGMSMWHDALDWLGGYPFEVAKPDHVISLIESHGLRLEHLKSVGNRGDCNQFLFTRG